MSSLLLSDEASYYQTILGIMRWVIELGCVDIAVEVSQLSSFLAMLRKGYMVSALHSMSYLRIKHNSCFVLDLSYAEISQSEFKSDQHWTAFYEDGGRINPLNAPTPLGEEVELIIFVDSDHAGDKNNR